MDNAARIEAAAQAQPTVADALRAGLSVLCADSDWPLARLTWLEGTTAMQVWSVRSGLEPVRDAWVAAGASASWAPRVAAAGRPVAFAFEMAEVPRDFAERALAAHVRYVLVFPLFDGEDVAGAVEVCCNEPCAFDGLRESLVRLGRLLGGIAERKRAA
ncbi:MAG TPA: GAF domain-containing protein [Myxococcales bacterium]|nr:GAF domain-containing protein [Myxococcales bacterium]